MTSELSPLRPFRPLQRSNSAPPRMQSEIQKEIKIFHETKKFDFNAQNRGTFCSSAFLGSSPKTYSLLSPTPSLPVDEIELSTSRLTSDSENSEETKNPSTPSEKNSLHYPGFSFKDHFYQSDGYESDLSEKCFSPFQRIFEKEESKPCVIPVSVQNPDKIPFPLFSIIV